MAEQSRHEILAELWGCTVEEARERDEAKRAQILAESAAADVAAAGTESAPVKPVPVKKTDAVAKEA